MLRLTIGIAAFALSVAPASVPVAPVAPASPPVDQPSVPVDQRLTQSDLQTVANLLAIEDARAPAPELVAELVGALRLDVRIARIAVRALGRLERPALVDVLIPQLLSPDPGIRLEGAHAIGQALAGTDPNKAALTAKAIDAMTALLAHESDFSVRGAICETLGRLPFHTIDRHRAIERLLVANTRMTNAPSGMAAFFMPGIAGAAKGLEALIRLHQKSAGPETPTIERLRQLVTSPLPPQMIADPLPPRSLMQPDRNPENTHRARTTVAEWTRADAELRHNARYFAMLALVAARATDARTIKAAREKIPLPGKSGVGERGPASLRRLALTALAQTDGADRFDELIAETLSDKDELDEVRYEAMRVSGPRRADSGCRHLFGAVEDRSPHVTLLAIDLMDARCPADETVRVLTDLVESLSSVGGLRDDGPAKQAPRPQPQSTTAGSRLRKAGTWHRAAHAIVSLAKVSPEAARKVLPDFAKHDIWQVRMYAARAAAVLNDGDLLEKLASDDHDNVREAAIPALSRVREHGADALYLAALERPDYQLIRTAAAALEGTPLRDRTAEVILQTLKRLTKQRRDTSRDPRVALLQRLREVGGPAQVNDVRDYLTDFDPRVATLAAELMTLWTGDPFVAKPQPLPLPPPPTADELETLWQGRAFITMRGGAVLVMRFLTSEAPLAATRFARLAQAGYYNGLTFHRVVPNFVIQGGSPGANEYMGDGPYMRDEVGLMPHDARTVGVSTRGRDTGDAQIFVNLIDNTRLDHDYTVFATLVDGDFCLHDILEGDVIEKVEIQTTR